MDDNLPHELAEGIEHLTAARYYIIASIVVLYFDWLLTFSLEVERFWRSKLTWPSVIFALNRYVPIVVLIPEAIACFTNVFSPEVRPFVVITITFCGMLNCAKRIVPLIAGVNVGSQSLIGMVLLLRAYALYNRNRGILILLCTAWAAATGVGIWGASCLVPLVLPSGTPGCLTHVSDNLEHRVSAAYFALLSYDALIYTLTLGRAFAIWDAKLHFTIRSNTLVGLIMRDGSIYYTALLGSTLLSILLIYLAPSDLRNINATFNLVIPVTIASRLLLNLRQGINEGGTQPTNWMSSVADFSLTSGDIMGTIGGNFEGNFEDEESVWFDCNQELR